MNKECQEYHLTARGWAFGSFKADAADGGRVDVPTPRDRVLTIGCYEEFASEFSKPTRYKQVLWKSDNRRTVQKLKKNYGERPPVQWEKLIATRIHVSLL